MAPGHSDAHLERLRCDGIDTEVYQRTGQLEVRSTVDAYLPDGRFEQDRMVEVFTALASGNTDEPYSLSRIVCDMDWAADVDVDREELVEFESRINDLWSQHDDIVICIYDLTKFRADFVVDVLRTHPLALVGATLRENPFFIPPSEFLQERQTRNASTEEQSDAAE